MSSYRTLEQWLHFALAATTTTLPAPLALAASTKFLHLHPTRQHSAQQSQARGPLTTMFP
ncbi:uncharacterized protein B0J16DRAFT_385607 [Fusarium flagelliforme]|uniref:uncharacterized protein n=1 Tax=Fusarium flagelliforme TaxID=2675880 RepID=UPI001E8EAA43|nr:uncharacterized protein B0J16DRAFT_385607 [Fusarium flagelliforme]KAH7182534.1 hypothetical protein B0J16DRAFT_385607 [Fusarium flagelliforme]